MALLLACVATRAATNDPAWWSSRHVLDTNAPVNDFAPAVQGQLKYIASNACAEFQDHLPGGAGTVVVSRIAGFSPTNNYCPVVIGQLKYVAAPFYDRLRAVEYTSSYPWTESTNDDADFAPANVGQVKNVFSFDVTGDADDDDLPDWWEKRWFGGVTNWGGAEDPDGDELANSNEYVWSTCPTNSDTDGDGAGDGAEVIAGTDPLNNPGDRDFDGLSDDLEEVLDTDADMADTDGDWVSDGYEYEQNTDPLDSGSAPVLRLVVEDGDFYARSSTLEIRIRGLVADDLILAEALTMENSVTSPCSELVYFSLPNEENTTRSVCAVAARGETNTRYIATASIILDTVPPYLSVTNPSSGLITADRWVRVEGVATDAVSAVCVKLNGGWADGVSSGRFWKGRFTLAEGTNLIGITGADDAGNCVTQVLTVVQDLSLDTNAPVMSLDMPSDFTVQGGTTNWNYGVTTFGDETNLAFRGSIDDETAVVNIRVEGPLETNGPYGAGVGGGTQVWGEVSLFAGTNRLVATAEDAAGNVSTCLWTVVRDTDFMFRITSPSPWAVVNGDMVFVTCEADPEFSNAVVTVNGQSASVVAGSNLTFRTDVAVPLGNGVTKISACAVLNGQSYYADPGVTRHKVTFWRSEEYRDTSYVWFYDFGENYEYEITRWDDIHTWDRDGKMHAHCTEWNDWCKPWGGTLTHYSSYDCPSMVATSWPGGSTKFGLENKRSSRLYKDGYENVTYDGEIRIIDDSMIADKELVYLQFPGFDYGRSTNESMDPSKITFRGQPGFWYNSNVTFVAEIACDTEYVIARSDFDWPTYSYSNAYHGGFWSTGLDDYSGRWLRIGTVESTVLEADILRPIGDARDSARGNVAPHSFLDNTNSPGVPPFRYDWQGVLASVPNGYGLNVQGDVDPDGFGYNWTLTSACGTFTNSASPIPGHIPPSSISGNSVTGTLTLEVMAGTAHTGATNSKQIVIYRDHLQRDMENFVAENLTTNHSQDGVMHGGANALGFACHDSTTHAHKGEKGRTDFWTNSNWAVATNVVVENQYQNLPNLGALSRGDVVAYYHGTNVSAATLAHSQTCTGNGNETWGANNKPMVEYDPWKFATAPAGSTYTNYDAAGNEWWTIRVYKKP